MAYGSIGNQLCVGATRVDITSELTARTPYPGRERPSLD